MIIRYTRVSYVNTTISRGSTTATVSTASIPLLPASVRIGLRHATIKIAAYAMSHAAAEARTQRVAAGRGHGYRLAAPSLQPERGTVNGPAC